MTFQRRPSSFSLEFEWELWAPGEYDLDDCNSDVWVTLDDGRRFVGTFFTLTNVGTLLENWARTGECAHGSYFWASDAVVVRRLDEETVRATVEDLLRDGFLETPLHLVIGHAD